MSESQYSAERKQQNIHRLMSSMSLVYNIPMINE